MHPSQNTSRTGRFRRLLGGVAVVGALAVAGAIATGHYLHPAQATATAAAAEQAVPVTVAMIEPRQTALWTTSPADWKPSTESNSGRGLPVRSLRRNSPKARW